MSWNFTAASNAPIAEVEAKFDEAAAAYEAGRAANDYTLDDAAKDGIAAARAAVKAVVESGAVGSGLVTVTVSGHANPGHKPAKGWSNDCVQVYVVSADPQPTT